MNPKKVSLAGGLGNQLFQYAYALSQFQGEPIELDWRLGPAILNSRGFPEISDFKLSDQVYFADYEQPRKYLIRIVRLMRQASSTDKAWVKSKVFSPAKLLARIMISNYFKAHISLLLADGTGYFKKNELERNSLAIGFFHSYKWAHQEGVRNKLQNLRLKQDSSLVDEYRNSATNESPLVVHVRLGDYESQEGFGIPSKDYYLNSISKQWSTGKYRKIWVFTNNQNKAERLIPAEYLDFVRWIPNISNSSVETLEVMRLGVGYVIGNSTYSWWGAYLSYTSEPEVIAPNPWFRSAKSPSELIPPNWSTFEAWN